MLVYFRKGKNEAQTSRKVKCVCDNGVKERMNGSLNSLYTHDLIAKRPSMDTWSGTS